MPIPEPILSQKPCKNTILNLNFTYKEREREKDEVADDDGCLPEAGVIMCVCVCGSRTLGAERKERDGADKGGAEGDVGEGSRDLGSQCMCVGE